MPAADYGGEGGDCEWSRAEVCPFMNSNGDASSFFLVTWSRSLSVWSLFIRNPVSYVLPPSVLVGCKLFGLIPFGVSVRGFVFVRSFLTFHYKKWIIYVSSGFILKQINKSCYIYNYRDCFKSSDAGVRSWVFQ